MPRRPIRGCSPRSFSTGRSTTPTPTPFPIRCTTPSPSASGSIAPFGKGDKPTTGYCVGLRTEAPARAVKAITAIPDADALLTPDLLRLTRWLADYYLCGWGQVLQAILPAGVRQAAGVRRAVVVTAVPEADLPADSRSWPANRRRRWTNLRRAGGPVELRELGPAGPNAGRRRSRRSSQKGYARKSTMRVERGSAEPGA